MAGKDLFFFFFLVYLLFICSNVFELFIRSFKLFQTFKIPKSKSPFPSFPFLQSPIPKDSPVASVFKCF